MRTNTEQDIEQIAGIIEENYGTLIAHDPDAEPMAEWAATINATTGWTYEVRYDSHEYIDDRSCTRVTGRVLGFGELQRAIALAEEPRQ